MTGSESQRAVFARLYAQEKISIINIVLGCCIAFWHRPRGRRSVVTLALIMIHTVFSWSLLGHKIGCQSESPGLDLALLYSFPWMRSERALRCWWLRPRIVPMRLTWSLPAHLMSLAEEEGDLALSRAGSMWGHWPCRPERRRYGVRLDWQQDEQCASRRAPNVSSMIQEVVESDKIVGWKLGDVTAFWLECFPSHDEQLSGLKKNGEKGPFDCSWWCVLWRQGLPTFLLVSRRPKYSAPYSQQRSYIMDKTVLPELKI